MPSLMATLGVDRMSPDDRIRLVEEILDSLDRERLAPELTDAQRQELDRRLAILEAEPERGDRWEEVEARVLRRLRK